MILTYFDVEEEVTFTYVMPFDKSRILGESNKFGEVLVGLHVYDHLEHKILASESGWRYLFNVNLRYWEKQRKEKERGKATWKEQ